MNTLQTLARYKAWADGRLYATLAELPEAELSAPRRIVFGSMIRTLHHVYAMDRVWQAHLEGRPHGYTTRNPAEHPPLAELRLAQEEIDAWYIVRADAMGEGARNEVLRFAFIGGGEGAMSRSEILLHVVNHTTYHRGHIADMLYELGRQPPVTDLPVFLGGR